MKNLQRACWLSVALLLSFLTLWLACSKPEKNEACATCRSKPPEVIKTITVADQVFSVGIYSTSTAANFTLAKVQHENKETGERMQQLLQSLDNSQALGKLLAAGYVPVNYNVFIKNSVRQQPDFNKEAIKAIGVILYKDHGLHHFLFTRNGSAGGLAIDEKYSTITNALNLIDKYLLFERVIDNGTDMVSLVSLVTPAYPALRNLVTTRNKLRDLLQLNTFVNGRRVPVSSFDEPKCDPKVCTPIQDSPGECEERIGDMACVEDEDKPCAKREVSKASNKMSDFLQMDDAFYTLRDSILAGSPNGRTIISKYYAAGKYFKSNVSRIDLARTYGFITLLHSKVNALLADTESPAILFDTRTKNDALNYLASIRGLDASREWQESLDWLETLIIRYANRPGREVFAFLNS